MKLAILTFTPAKKAVRLFPEEKNALFLILVSWLGGKGQELLLVESHNESDDDDDGQGFRSQSVRYGRISLLNKAKQQLLLYKHFFVRIWFNLHFNFPLKGRKRHYCVVEWGNQFCLAAWQWRRDRV